MVVHSCSEQAKKTYEEKIVALIDQIRTQSEEYKQPERYQDILKSQRLWKAYVDQNVIMQAHTLAHPCIRIAQCRVCSACKALTKNTLIKTNYFKRHLMTLSVFHWIKFKNAK